VDGGGLVMAHYSNGESRPAGHLALAQFRDPSRLGRVGPTLCAANPASGPARLGRVGDAPPGAVGPVGPLGPGDPPLGVAPHVLELVARQSELREGAGLALYLATPNEWAPSAAPRD